MLNRVSFGRVIFPPKPQEKMSKQLAVQDVIDNVLNRETRPSQPVSHIVHNKLRADIVVTFLKNGDTEIKFQKSNKPQKKIFSKSYIDENIGNLKISNKKPLFQICEEVEDFADKCLKAAENYLTE